ncbi:MAG TPA: EAL domain-containing protein [Acidimicrobiales bacterium]|nr:EAL domain-containing protein [Acidimicrobiales bacterium]
MALRGDTIAQECGRPFGARLKDRLLDRAVLAGPPTAAALCLLRWGHFTAPLPYWLLITLVLVAQVVSNVAAAAWEAPTGWQVVAYVGVVQGVIGAVAYATGWGPILSLGFIFGAAYTLQLSGSVATLPAVGWSALCMGIGQLCIALGFVPSLITQPLVQGLAALGLLGVVLTVGLLGRFTAQREKTEARLAQSERRFKALVKNASDIIIVTDDSGIPAYVSPAFEKIMGYPTDYLKGHSAAVLMHSDDLAQMRAEAPSREDYITDRWITELRLRHADGSWRWFEASVANRLGDPDVMGIVANLHDITERKQADEELRQAHERFRSSFESAPIGMAMADLEGNILKANVSYARILGRSVTELVGLNVHDLTHPEDRHASLAEMHRHLEGGTEGYLIEKRYLHSDGHAVWASVNASCVRDSEGNPLYLIGQIEDITERRAYREHLAHAALHDPLTGLPNRVLFMDRLGGALTRSARHNHRVAVLFLDLDRFKRMNDSLGHDRGDLLLKAVAERLKASVRASDTVARFGGDEFVVLCDEVTDVAQAMGLARRITARLHSALDIEGAALFVTASVGVALGGHSTLPERLVRDADTAMYRAKENQRGTIELFVERDDVWSTRRLQMGNDLHLALQRSEFDLYYQPFVDLHTTTLVGVEALIRWRHPARGLVGPAEFIQLAEDIGLIGSLGRWVLQEACAQAARWRSLAAQAGVEPWRLSVSVNVSPRQLVDHSFSAQVGEVLADTGLDPNALWLEITEATLLRDPGQSIATLRALRDQGVHLSIDDFGTGYSSLAYLQQLPVECLKIDRTFVEGLGRTHHSQVITKAVIGLAESLGLACIAEGVETVAQVQELRRLGCGLAQGYLFGRPVPGAALGDYPGHDLSPRREPKTQTA